MSEHTPLPVHGYVPQDSSRIAIVNENKVTEEGILRVIDGMQLMSTEFDQRWLSIARTHIEQGFMALNRAVFRPARLDIEQIAKKEMQSERATDNSQPGGAPMRVGGAQSSL